ncbi:helix-turn-helix domain-containing protein [Parabacteroides sp.]|uniref:winged helix-turn-helix domain-containing protein n=1 Tax=Parabacteroides sp. TaxID=1869337 RepID=UPI00259B13B5|nr:helix-turn-helix domain-containing protein [uncultured Parabacteroides sp.]
MQLTLKKRVVGILFCLLMLIISLFIGGMFQGRFTSLEKVQDLLIDVVVQDGEVRIKEAGINYSSGYMPLSDTSVVTIQSEGKIDKVGENESVKCEQAEIQKDSRVKQTFLLSKNPINVIVLDSLFQSVLKENGLNLQTALVYTANGHTEYSCVDSTFYVRFTALAPVTTGIRDEIVIQGYVDIPLNYVSNREKVYLIILAVAFILVLILLVAIWRNKKLEKIIFEPVQKITRTRTQIKASLFFDREKGILYFNDDIQVSLINYKLKLFVLLLDSPGHFQTSEEIKKIVWGKTGATNDVLNTTIRRLRKDLENIPDLKIVFENGGYRLNIL